MNDNSSPTGENSQVSAKEEKVTPKPNRKQKKTKWDKRKQSRKEESLAAKENTTLVTPPKSQKPTKSKVKDNENKAIHQSPQPTKSQTAQEKLEVEAKGRHSNHDKVKSESQPNATESVAGAESEKQEIRKTTSSETGIIETFKEIHKETPTNDVNEVPTTHLENKMNDLGSKHLDYEKIAADAGKEAEAVSNEVITNINSEDNLTADELKSLETRANLNNPNIQSIEHSDFVNEEKILNNVHVASNADVNDVPNNSMQEYSTNNENNIASQIGYSDESYAYSYTKTELNLTETPVAIQNSKPHSVVNIFDGPAVNEHTKDIITFENEMMENVNGKESEVSRTIGTTYTCATTDTTYTVLSSEDDRDEISSPDMYVCSTPMTHIETSGNQNSKNKQKKKNKKGNKNKIRENENVSLMESEKSVDGVKYKDNGYGSPKNQYKENEKSISPIRPNSASDNSLVVTPLNVDTNRVVGRGRGIDGANNSCYMDSTLFSLFYTTDVFDDRLLTEMGCKGLPNKLSKDVRTILKDNIVYPLRQGHFCPKENIWKLRTAMKNLNAKLCGSFMDAEEFIFLLFEDALNVNEFLHYTTGTSDFMHQIIIDYNDTKKFVSTQYLFETSMKTLDELKLQSVPDPALFLEMPRSNRILVQYSGIIPSLQLDLTNVIVQCDFDNSATDVDPSITNSCEDNAPTALTVYKAPKPEISVKPSFPRRCFLAMCKVCWMIIPPTYRYCTPTFLQRFNNSIALYCFRTCVFLFAFFQPSRIHGVINYLIPTINDTDGDMETNEVHENTDIETGTPMKPMGRKLPERKLMDLIAVICIRGCHYTSYVKYEGDLDSASTWLFFDSMAGGGPEVEEVNDCEKWLQRLENEPENTKKLWDEIPWGVRRIIEDCHICIYKPAETVLQRVSTEFCTVENEHEKFGKIIAN